jgi:hypothetical protein
MTLKRNNIRLSLHCVSRNRTELLQQLLLMIGRIVRGDTAYEVGPHYFDIRYEQPK